jgi:hypothetical protein
MIKKLYLPFKAEITQKDKKQIQCKIQEEIIFSLYLETCPKGIIKTLNTGLIMSTWMKYDNSSNLVTYLIKYSNIWHRGMILMYNKE